MSNTIFPQATFTDSKTESKLANDDDILEADVSAKLQQQTIDRELAELAELAENEEENEIADVSEDYSQSRDESIASQKNGTERDGQSKENISTNVFFIEISPV